MSACVVPALFIPFGARVVRTVFALPLVLPVRAQFPSAGCCPSSTPLIPLFRPHTVGTTHSGGIEGAPVQIDAWVSVPAVSMEDRERGMFSSKSYACACDLAALLGSLIQGMGMHSPVLGDAPDRVNVTQCLSNPDTCEILPIPDFLSKFAVMLMRSPSPICLWGSVATIHIVPAPSWHHGLS